MSPPLRSGKQVSVRYFGVWPGHPGAWVQAVDNAGTTRRAKHKGALTAATQPRERRQRVDFLHSLFPGLLGCEVQVKARGDSYTHPAQCRGFPPWPAGPRAWFTAPERRRGSLQTASRWQPEAGRRPEPLPTFCPAPHPHPQPQLPAVVGPAQYPCI